MPPQIRQNALCMLDVRFSPLLRSSTVVDAANGQHGESGKLPIPCQVADPSGPVQPLHQTKSRVLTKAYEKVSVGVEYRYFKTHLQDSITCYGVLIYMTTLATTLS